MSEVQFWHWIATGALGVLIAILGWWGKSIVDDMKTKMSKEEFKSYLDDASESRRNLRDSIVKMFERIESHEKLDGERFQTLTKDFNGGLARITDTLYQSKLEIFDRINGKQDKAKS